MFFPRYFGCPIHISLNVHKECHTLTFILINQVLNFLSQRFLKALSMSPILYPLFWRTLQIWFNYSIKCSLSAIHIALVARVFKMSSFLEGKWCEFTWRYLSVCLLLVYLVCERTIILSHDKDIKKRKRIILLSLHCEFDVI